MKKVLLVLLSVLCLSLFCGCKDKTVGENHNISQDINIVKVYSELNGFDVYVHKETKVIYISISCSYPSLTVMVDENGKPLLWEGELE